MAENIIVRSVRAFAGMIGAAVATYLEPERTDALKKRKEYFEGDQKRPLKTKVGQADDNLIINWVGLAVYRSNSMLFGGGVKFITANPETQEYVDKVWEANKQAILLGRTGLAGEVFGTWYMKILPDALEHEGETYPRFVLLDPQLMSIQTDPMDIENVLAYVFEMRVENEERTIREITRRAATDGEIVTNAFGLPEGAPGGSWIVEKWESGGRSSQWVLLSSTVWAYPFPPIIHCQNLPSLFSVYGIDGFGGGLDVQDRHNLVVSNVSKIIRYHAHPRPWGRGIPSNSKGEKVSWGADEMIMFSSETAEIRNLEMQSDLSSSRNFAQDLKQAIFELARVVDIASLKDKIGALTNFGLRVLYGDALSKNTERRLLYGNALQELNRRVLVLNNMEGKNKLEWGSDLPQDEKEDAQLIREDLLAGLVSRETAATKRGYQWKSKTNEAGQVELEGEEDKIAAERAAGGQTELDALASLFNPRPTP